MQSHVIEDLRKLKNHKKAVIYAGFFKTGKGGYGEGDLFWGLTVPEQRKIAKKYTDIGTDEITELPKSNVHEHRLTALFILIDRYKKTDEAEKKKIFQLYLKHTKYINNWDLVDLSAPSIIGNYLLDKDVKILYVLAGSSSIWERRLAVIATYAFIRQKIYEPTLIISEMLLSDTHDLIHKAVGWMLREMGKRDQKLEEKFLDKYYHTMPRTMLRYAIEKFSDNKRKHYLSRSPRNGEHVSAISR